MVGGTLALGAVGTASRIALSPDGLGTKREPGPALQLSADPGSDVGSLAVRLGDDLLPKISTNKWGSTQLATSVHSMVGFTWGARSKTPRIQINSRIDGVWSGWRGVNVLHDLPDPGSEDDAGILGTELTWIGDADGIQIRVGGDRPSDLTMVLLHPARRFSDQALVRNSSSSSSFSARSSSELQKTKKPKIYSRQEWGADESWRDGSPRYIDTIEQIHVHHTVSSNDYAEADVPSLIRGMYRYHTKNLGWSDIGYNFLVDRFGRIWTGRAGGASKAVRGAHTLGFNASSAGVSVIGNFETAKPSSAVLNAIASVAAWKLSKYGHTASGTVQVVSEGSDKYRSGRVANLPVIDGHRDTNDTACPGANLYAKLPAIRRKTDKIIAAAQQQPIVVSKPTTLSGRPVLGETLTTNPATIAPSDATTSYVWLRDGAAIGGATGPTYVAGTDDIGTQLSVRITHARSGYQSAQETLSADGVTKVRSAMKVWTRGGPGRAKVIIDLSAVGLDTVPTGRVKIKINNRKKWVDIKPDGRAKATFIGFAARRYEVIVRYPGSETMLPIRLVEKVRVRKK